MNETRSAQLTPPDQEFERESTIRIVGTAEAFSIGIPVQI
jgi:hypothetical protein